MSIPDAEPEQSPAGPDAPAGLPAPEDAPRKRGRWGPIGTYWRGEYSLGVSFWVVSLIVELLAAGILFSVALGIGAIDFYNPYSAFGIVVFAWTAVLLVSVWDNVGLWRAARRHKSAQRARGRTRFWAVLVQILIVLGVMSTVKDFVMVATPQFRGSYALAFQGDPEIEDFSIRVMRDGTELEISGGFKYGLDRALRAALAAAPTVKVVHLSSPGGRLGEAMKVHKTIADNKLDTYVAVGCYSACSLAFGAGRERWIAEDGKLGFHSAAVPGWAQSDAEVSNLQQRAILLKDGLDADFVREALATPSSSMFTPTPEELLAAHAITGVAPDDKFAASGLGAALTQEDFNDWIEEVAPLFVAVEEGDPEGTARMYARYFAGYVSGATRRSIIKMVGGDLSALLAKKRPLMDDETALEAGRLLVDEYRHLGASDPKLCHEFSEGVTGNRADEMLSEELSDRETLLRVRIITSASPPPHLLPEETLDDGWRAVVSEIMAGPHAKHFDIFGRTPTPEQYSDYCAISVTYYETILKQPAPLAAGLMRQTLTP